MYGTPHFDDVDFGGHEEDEEEGIPAANTPSYEREEEGDDDGDEDNDM